MLDKDSKLYLLNLLRSFRSDLVSLRRDVKDCVRLLFVFDSDPMAKDLNERERDLSDDRNERLNDRTECMIEADMLRLSLRLGPNVSVVYVLDIDLVVLAKDCDLLIE